MPKYPKISVHEDTKAKLEQLKVVYRDVGVTDQISIAQTIDAMTDSAIAVLKKSGKWPYGD